MEILLAFLVCIFATTVGSVSGLGGGVIIKPVMDAVSTLPVAQISFLSSCTVWAMAVVAYFKTRGKVGEVNTKALYSLAGGAAVGGVIGKFIFNYIKSLSANPEGIGTIQNIIMVILIGGIFIYLKNQSKIKTLNVVNPAVCVAIGFTLGTMSSFLGIGGGPINLVALFFFFSMAPKMAAYGSIFIILLSQSFSIVTTLVTNSVADIPMVMLVVMVIGGVAGGLIGAKLSLRLADKQISTIFTWTLVGIILLSAYNVVIAVL